MKKQCILAILIFFVLFEIGTAHAMPMNYTFQGVITSCFADNGWDGSGSTTQDWRDLNHGQVISFTYLLDLDIISQPDGSDHDVLLVSHSDNFFIDNISPGSDIVESKAKSPLTGFPGYDSFIRSENDFNYTKFGYPNGSVCGGGTDYIWELGDLFYGYSYKMDNGVRTVFGYEFNAQLVNVAPVPEPESALLIFCGFVILRRYINKKRVV